MNNETTTGGMFDPYYVAEVLAKLLSKQRGRVVTIELTPKEPDNRKEAGHNDR